MNIFAIGGLSAVTAGLLYIFVEQKPADVYDMPVQQAYGLLAASNLGEADAPEWSSLKVSNTGNGVDQLTWQRSTSHARSECDLSLTPFEGDANRTHVAIDCEGASPSSGAASGIAFNMVRNAMIERIDSALTGREFDSERAGSTASRWPASGVDGSYGTAVKNAIKMDADMRRMKKEAGEMEKERREQALRDAEQAKWDAFNSGDSSDYGEPTTSFD